MGTGNECVAASTEAIAKPSAGDAQIYIVPMGRNELVEGVD